MRAKLLHPIREVKPWPERHLLKTQPVSEEEILRGAGAPTLRVMSTMDWTGYIYEDVKRKADNLLEEIRKAREAAESLPRLEAELAETYRKLKEMEDEMVAEYQAERAKASA